MNAKLRIPLQTVLNSKLKIYIKLYNTLFPGAMKGNSKCCKKKYRISVTGGDNI